MHYARKISATDADPGASLQYSASSQFTGLPDSLVWEPADTGTYAAWVKVADDSAASDSIGWQIRVADTTTAETSTGIDLDSGLVAYYPFAGNANDASGNGNDGTVNGAILTADRFGTSGAAYQFDGANDYISLPFGEDVFSNAMTISLWFSKTKSTTTDGDQGLISCDLSADRGTAIWVNDVDLCYQNMLVGQTGMGAGLNDTAIGDDWIHVVGSYDGDTGALYVNGSRLVTNAKPGTIDNNSRDFEIGHSPYDGSTFRYFGGSIDDIRIYNRALDSAEIDSLYHEGGLDWQQEQFGFYSILHDTIDNDDWFIFIDEADWQIDTIGRTGYDFNYWNSMAFDNVGRLWMTHRDSIFTVNQQTGLASFIGTATPFAAGDLGLRLAFNTQGIAYVVQELSGMAQGKLYTMNLTTFELTEVSSSNSGLPSITGIVFDVNDQLWAVDEYYRKIYQLRVGEKITSHI
jgi:hypothetical protein